MDALRNTDIKEYYDRQTGGLNGAYEEDRWHATPVKRFEYRQTMRSLKRALGSRKYERAIEVGPGDAVWTPLIRERVTGPIHLIEQSEAMLESARKKLAAMPSISYEQSDFEASVPPFKADLIVLSRCFEYFANKDQAMAHIADMLAPGGRVVIITKNPRMVTSRSVQGRAMHSGQVTPGKLRQLAEAAGLAVELAFPAVVRWKAGWAPMRALFDAIHKLAIFVGTSPLPGLTFATESYAYVLLRKDEESSGPDKAKTRKNSVIVDHAPKKGSAPSVVITGGLGFIFSHVTEHFVRKGWRVVVIDNLSEGSNPDLIDGSFVHLDLHMANPDVVDTIVNEKPDYLIHAAAITDVDYSIREPYRTFRKNLLGTLHAFEASRRLPGLKKFMYIGTDEVYGECEHPMREDEVLLPRSPYSASKAAGSLMRTAYDNTYPTLSGKIVDVRMCNIFGPRQDTRKIMPQIRESLASGHSIPLHNGGTGFREYLYVKNVPPAIELMLREGEGTYNVTAGDGLTVRELIARAEAVTGKKVTTHDSMRPGMDLKYQVDASRVRALGWKPEYSFDEGLKEYLGS
ncbi:MAG: GDP-mannose 4,6-dehydratase [Candidatus Pacebacteria bacterium]|nr:GDP-mannose 4,6-dehydratase [Candidatus Paceibacterota bacterium]MBP9840727.1 GDP-mannose 4,6-dehydratase [Candidatus Paceibacterota bacterium]